ncbi:hypothetical protein EJ076_18495 [Mesorhizobium sp. M7D.F.Ca.US.005.01.1.1]|uniref:hypothetical protein n=1 Tax=Mesorhizobium sp. M7D.F.Ca.US.005.01.1.1 TaxID=2493678 RepID=UPI000F765C5F|nr:hypothetical protein [Mesorhizobium sp. M7D.F.Ca.US.005.01.1.1]AZO42944.1 hypothetical protein EJ076_18495 [Mesorhizobium sp. M7D.F.Ca.US.005.01.1.1]
MKTTLILGALALCLAAPAVASADAIVITTNKHHHRQMDRERVAVINEDGARLHHRKHGTEAFYDHGKRNWHRKHRSDTIVIRRSDDRPMHRHRHVVIQNGDY